MKLKMCTTDKISSKIYLKAARDQYVICDQRMDGVRQRKGGGLNILVGSDNQQKEEV